MGFILNQSPQKDTRLQPTPTKRTALHLQQPNFQVWLVLVYARPFGELPFKGTAFNVPIKLNEWVDLWLPQLKLSMVKFR